MLFFSSSLCWLDFSQIPFENLLHCSFIQVFLPETRSDFPFTHSYSKQPVEPFPIRHCTWQNSLRANNCADISEAIKIL